MTLCCPWHYFFAGSIFKDFKKACAFSPYAHSLEPEIVIEMMASWVSTIEVKSDQQDESCRDQAHPHLRLVDPRLSRRRTAYGEG